MDKLDKLPYKILGCVKSFAIFWYSDSIRSARHLSVQSSFMTTANVSGAAKFYLIFSKDCKTFCLLKVCFFSFNFPQKIAVLQCINYFDSYFRRCNQLHKPYGRFLFEMMIVKYIQAAARSPPVLLMA